MTDLWDKRRCGDIIRHLARSHYSQKHPARLEILLPPWSAPWHARRGRCSGCNSQDEGYVHAHAENRDEWRRQPCSMQQLGHDTLVY